MAPAGGLLYPSSCKQAATSFAESLHLCSAFPFAQSTSFIGCTGRTYTPSHQDVYVSRAKRIRFARTRYTSSRHSLLPPRTNAPLRRPRPYRFCRGVEEVCCRKSLSSWCFPGREVSFIRSVQRTATSRPQPIRIRGKVREADSLPDTRGRIVSSKNKRYDYPSYIYFDRGACIQLPHHLFD